MLGRQNEQYSFGDMQAANRISEKHFILRIDREIDWKSISRNLDALYDPKKGRPSFPPLVMLKTLLLQQWYNLSDPEAEETICDRLSFQKFLGLSMSDSVPDETTICRFRNKLVSTDYTKRSLRK